jgi:hypothetical protein
LNVLAAAGQPGETTDSAPRKPAAEPARRERPEEGRAKLKEARNDSTLMDFESRPITALTVNIGHKAGEKPQDVGQAQLARMQAKTDDGVFARNWPMVCYQWEAPALAHRPLYFEEVNLERYGYGVKYARVAQPAISAGQFFLTLPILPYKMLAEPAREPVYTLGHYRPGSDVPYQVVVPPPDLSGATIEAGVMTGLIFVIP